MNLPSRLTITGAAYAPDGGTTCLRATDEGGRGHLVKLVQYAFLRADPPLGALPGRLYFDGQLVPQWSELEAGVLCLLRSAESRDTTPCPGQISTGGREADTCDLTARVIRFVESELYLIVGRWTEMASDPTRYDLRVAWNAANRKRVMVRLARVLGVGVQAAGGRLDDNQPLATGPTALEVIALAQHYRASDLGVQATPEFRWGLP